MAKIWFIGLIIILIINAIIYYSKIEILSMIGIIIFAIWNLFWMIFAASSVGNEHNGYFH